jgi:hypothetical protein
MSDEFFTRETWRPSKKRKMQKRTKLWGGRKTAPPAFLEAAKRTQIQKGFANRRICTSAKRDGGRCGNLALTGLSVCGCHGGFGIWAKQGKLQPSGRSAAFRAAAVEGRSPVAPFALTQIKLYQLADQWSRMRLIKAWGQADWMRVVKRVQERVTGVCA